MSVKSEIEYLENRLKEIPKEIKNIEKLKNEILSEEENAKLEVELLQNELKYNSILIKEMLEDFREDGIEILKEIAPEILQEIGSETSH